jgi:hypothetical protein
MVWKCFAHSCASIPWHQSFDHAVVNKRRIVAGLAASAPR